MTERPKPDHRSAYVYFQTMTTRWMDNDSYRHMNNTTYYSFFDTIVNMYLIENAVLDVEKSEVIGLVAETMCRYFRSIGFPSKIDVGLRVGHLGNSSIRYEIALFNGDEDVASAQGHFVHVYVDRESGRPTPLPEKLKSIAAPLQRAVT
ncbi:MAG: acyl-CoA thioesterase [Afipia sp.]|jgi:acyl-CoA thioester hydrolase|nr:acyl-CoA thioesterase [Afipia sp.]MCR6737021.1 acyl-CoA thioesterase [Afipia sp.]